MAIFGRKVHVTETPDVRHITNPDVMHEESSLLRQKYDWDLTHYGQPDPSTGMVRVPVDEAMQRLLQKGLPARPAQPDTPSVNGGMDVPSYSSAGRQTEKRDAGEQ